MENGKDDKLVALLAVVHAKWEAVHYSLPHFSEDLRISLRVHGRLIEHPLHCGSKPRSQSLASLLVSVSGGIEFSAGSAAKSDAEAHFRNRSSASALICSQGTTSPGLAS